MKTLNDHNYDKRNLISPPSAQAGAGVVCNECGIEMVYKYDNVVLASNPPQAVVVCPKCNVVGYKVL